MRIALVVPHIFMHQRILPRVIFSPGQLALNLAQGLVEAGHEVCLFSPGPIEELAEVSSGLKNITADLSLFEKELAARGDDYIDLLKKHPLTFISLARQVQSELIAQAFEQANQGNFDLVHVWANEEELALVNARFCQKPVVFTHHEPFNFLVKYRSIFPKYSHLNWISLSYAQRQTLQKGDSEGKKKVNWVGNVYHGLPLNMYSFEPQPKDYLLYMGRIIKPKGVHLAIAAAKQAGKKLIIAGKHYAGHSKDKYWQEQIKPEIDGQQIKYVGFVKDLKKKQKLLGQAQALLMPSTWSEPFGLVMIEALACGTPVIGFDRGAISEVVGQGSVGRVVEWSAKEEEQALTDLVQAIKEVGQIERHQCREYFEQKFSLKEMVEGYEEVYQKLVG